MRLFQTIKCLASSLSLHEEHLSETCRVPTSFERWLCIRRLQHLIALRPCGEVFFFGGFWYTTRDSPDETRWSCTVTPSQLLILGLVSLRSFHFRRRRGASKILSQWEIQWEHILGTHSGSTWGLPGATVCA